MRLTILLLLLAAWPAPPASAQGPVSEIATRAAALTALEESDARLRLAAVIYLGHHGLAADGPLLAKRLFDDDPVVREAAEQAIWLAWSRSGDAEADRLLATGVEQMNAGELERAITTFGKVIERKPQFAEGWNKRATAYFLAGELRKSLADCEEVMKRNPLHFGALSGYGQIYVQLGDYARALEYFRRALAVNPNLTGLEAVILRLEELLREQRRRTI